MCHVLPCLCNAGSFQEKNALNIIENIIYKRDMGYFCDLHWFGCYNTRARIFYIHLLFHTSVEHVAGHRRSMP